MLSLLYIPRETTWDTCIAFIKRDTNESMVTLDDSRLYCSALPTKASRNKLPNYE